jgi:hypothetical protein
MMLVGCFKKILRQKAYDSNPSISCYHRETLCEPLERNLLKVISKPKTRIQFKETKIEKIIFKKNKFFKYCHRETAEISVTVRLWLIKNGVP